MSALLAVDIGNTTIGLCLFFKAEDGTKFSIKKIPAHPVQSAKTYKKIILEFMDSAGTNHNVEQLEQFKHSSIRSGNLRLALPVDHKINAVISSVVPALNKHVIKAVTEACKKRPLIVNHKLDFGLILDVEQPEKVGTDRIANAVAGFHYFKKPVAIVDFGTATTLTVVGRRQTYIGGAIMPGISLMQKALHSGTAKLPPVVLKIPEKFLGKNTVSSIISGIMHGTAAAVESLIKGMEKEINFKVKLVLTGGYAKLMSPLIKRKHIVAEGLIFEGLRLIYLKNRG